MGIPWSKPKLGEREKTAAREVIDSGWWTQGEEVEQFEADLRARIGSPVSIVSNGTMALIAALLAHDIGADDEVLIPTYTFVATANAVLVVGAEPVFVDADPATFNLDFEDLRRKASSETDAIVSVDVGGMPNDLDAIADLCEDIGAIHVEDAAEAIGAEHDNDPIGSHEHTAIFSFHMAKLVSSVEGGAVAGSASVCEAVDLIRNHGMSTGYHCDRFGLNFRMTDIRAAIGRTQLRQLDEFVDRRNRLVERYRERLPTGIRTQLIPEYVTTHPHMLLPVRFEDRETRDAVDRALNRNDIATRICWPPIHRQPFIERRFGNVGDFPGADELFETSLALPIGNAMNEEEVDEVCNTITATLDG